MKILFLDNQSNAVGSTRIHVTHLGQLMEEFGCSVLRTNRLSDMQSFKPDVLILGKTQRYCAAVAAARESGVLIGDINPSDTSPEKIEKLKKCNFFIVGSAEERDYYLKFCKNVYIFPQIEKIDLIIDKTEDYLLRSGNKIVYHGNKMHLNEISIDILNALRNVQNSHNTQLVCIYDKLKLGEWKNPKELNVTHIQWDESTWLDEIAKCDIGIVPMNTYVAPNYKHVYFSLTKLLDFRRGRVGFRNDNLVRSKNNSNAGRSFVFHQLRIPVVAEMSCSNSEMLYHQDNGYLCSSEAAWTEALEELLKSSARRHEVAEHAYLEFHRRYNPVEWAYRVYKGVQSLANKNA